MISHTTGMMSRSSILIFSLKRSMDFWVLCLCSFQRGHKMQFLFQKFKRLGMNTLHKKSCCESWVGCCNISQEIWSMVPREPITDWRFRSSENVPWTCKVGKNDIVYNQCQCGSQNFWVEEVNQFQDLL